MTQIVYLVGLFQSVWVWEKQKSASRYFVQTDEVCGFIILIIRADLVIHFCIQLQTLLLWSPYFSIILTQFVHQMMQGCTNVHFASNKHDYFWTWRPLIAAKGHRDIKDGWFKTSCLFLKLFFITFYHCSLINSVKSHSFEIIFSISSSVSCHRALLWYPDATAVLCRVEDYLFT